MKNALVVLLVLFVSFPVLARPNASVQKKIADRAATEMLLQCRESDDKMGCLERRGAVCESVEGKKKDEHRCTTTITLTFNKVGYAGNVGSQGGEATFEIAYRVYMGKKGWRVSKHSVRRVKA